MSGDRSRDGRIGIEAIKAAHDIVAVAQRYTRLVRAGHLWKGLSPLKGERTPSFVVYPHNQSFFCFSSGQGGDVIKLIELAEGCTTAQAIEGLKREAGLDGTDEATTARRETLARERAAREANAAAAEQQRRDAMARHAADVVLHSWPAAGTDVERYLRWRGVELDAIAALYEWPRPVPANLRFAPGLEYRSERRVVHTGPTMVGVISPAPVAFHAAMPVRSCHRTWLAQAGRGKASIRVGGETLPSKLTLGDVWSSAGWLTYPSGAFGCPQSNRRVDSFGSHMIVGEGYETTLTVLGVMAKAGLRVTSASALSLGNLAGAGLGRGAPHPDRPGLLLPSAIPNMAKPGLQIPDGVTQVTILADADGCDRRSTEVLVMRAAARWRAQGLAVRIAWPDVGSDFNDMVMRGASGDDVLEKVLATTERG